jgi:hypothetical protein
MQLGCALEDTLISRYMAHYPDRYLRIGEIERDNLFGTPDLIDLNDGGVEEYKLSWMSLKHGPGSEKFWKYEVQLKSYCYMLDSSIGRLHVCYVNGDYKWSKGPESGVVYRVWEYHFTPQQLEENWKMMQTNAKYVQAEG